MWSLHAGAAVKFHQVSLTIHIKYTFICQFPQSKTALLTELILTIKAGFCCNNVLLFYGTALKIC